MEPHRLKVLIISYYFAPQNSIGAVRPTKLAKYLTRMGCDVTVLCGPGMQENVDPTLERDMGELTDVRVIREWNPLRDYKARKRQSGAVKPEGQAAVAPTAFVAPSGGANAADTNAPVAGRTSLKRRVLNTVYLYLWVLSDKSFRRRAMAELTKLGGGYDAVFSSYAPMSVNEVACHAKQRGLAKRWVADFRDEVGVSFSFEQGRKNRLMRMVEQNADVRCGVSQGILEHMGLWPSAEVLPNGFDPEDAPAVAPRKPDGTFRVVYCGQFLMGRKDVGDRDITPAFRALAKLIEQGVISRDMLKLVYAGNAGSTFTAYARTCGLEDCVELHGQVSREESLRLQAGADLLLMATYNSQSHKGILTGKLFEYMMMDKPIICCTAGDLAQSAIKTVLETTETGFCAEEATGEEDQIALEGYIKQMILRWKQEKPLLISKNIVEVDKYTYPSIAEKLVTWLSPQNEQQEGYQ